MGGTAGITSGAWLGPLVGDVALDEIASYCKRPVIWPAPNR